VCLFAGGSGWRVIVLEELLDKRERVFANHNKMGYIDFKHMLIADPLAPPLHLKITVQSSSYVRRDKIADWCEQRRVIDWTCCVSIPSSQLFLCEPTRFFGQTASTAAHFWVLKPDVFLTTDVKDYATFSFQKGKDCTPLTVRDSSVL